MRMRIFSVIAVIVLAGSAITAQAASVPAEVDLPALRTIQPYSLDEKTPDQIYLFVTGVANGKEISERFPKEKALSSGPKAPAVTEKRPITVWNGQLDDGEFALLTVTLFQGVGSDSAKESAFTQKLGDALKKVDGAQKETLDQAAFAALAKETLKADREIVAKIKDTFSRDAKTDHFGGQFTLILWNNAGKLVKRLDPVGLTFGEHFGTDVKTYTELKNTRNNVLLQDEKGQWSQQSLTPVSDDDSTLRVKMLDTEAIKGGAEPVKHVTDYLVELQVLDLSGGNKTPLKWELDGEQTGYDAIHTYWDWVN